MKPDWVIIGIQPKECLRIEMQVKESGPSMKTRTISLDASLRTEDEESYDPCEDLLLDVIKGDQSQFLRFGEVDGACKVVDPVLRVWTTERDYIPTYPADTWGPQENAGYLSAKASFGDIRWNLMAIKSGTPKLFALYPASARLLPGPRFISLYGAQTLDPYSETTIFGRHNKGYAQYYHSL